MRIFIFGVSQVGKSTIGRALAEKLKFKLIDIDYELVDMFGSIEEFHQQVSLKIRQKSITRMVINYKLKDDDFVMAVTPIYSYEAHEVLSKELEEDICVNLTASSNTIFDRLGFYDEKGQYLDDSIEYKNLHKEEYMKIISNDNIANNYEFSFYHQINTDNKTINEVVDEIIDYINSY